MANPTDTQKMEKMLENISVFVYDAGVKNHSPIVKRYGYLMEAVSWVLLIFNVSLLFFLLYKREWLLTGLLCPTFLILSLVFLFKLYEKIQTPLRAAKIQWVDYLQKDQALLKLQDRNQKEKTLINKMIVKKKLQEIPKPVL